MNRDRLRRKQGRPPWWFMPAVLAGLGDAGTFLSADMLAAR